MTSCEAYKARKAPKCSCESCAEKWVNSPFRLFARGVQLSKKKVLPAAVKHAIKKQKHFDKVVKRRAIRFKAREEEYD